MVHNKQLQKVQAGARVKPTLAARTSVEVVKTKLPPTGSTSSTGENIGASFYLITCRVRLLIVEVQFAKMIGDNYLAN